MAGSMAGPMPMQPLVQVLPLPPASHGSKLQQAPGKQQQQQQQQPVVSLPSSPDASSTEHINAVMAAGARARAGTGLRALPRARSRGLGSGSESRSGSSEWSESGSGSGSETASESDGSGSSSRSSSRSWSESHSGSESASESDSYSSSRSSSGSGSNGSESGSETTMDTHVPEDSVTHNSAFTFGGEPSRSVQPCAHAGKGQRGVAAGVAGAAGAKSSWKSPQAPCVVLAEDSSEEEEEEEEGSEEECSEEGGSGSSEASSSQGTASPDSRDTAERLAIVPVPPMHLLALPSHYGCEMGLPPVDPLDRHALVVRGTANAMQAGGAGASAQGLHACRLGARGTDDANPGIGTGRVKQARMAGAGGATAAGPSARAGAGAGAGSALPSTGAVGSCDLATAMGITSWPYILYISMEAVSGGAAQAVGLLAAVLC